MARWLNYLANWYQRRSQLRQPWQRQRYVALDIETTGLDPTKHEVLSIAWMSITPPVIHLGSAQYHVLAQTDALELGQSPTIHGLTQSDFLHSSDPRQTYAMLSRALHGAVLVCHHRGMDWRFLRHIQKQHGVIFDPLAIFDTLAFERNVNVAAVAGVPKDHLTLRSCRRRHGLPEYSAHHALDDALACAELFLAQATKFDGQQASAVDLLKKCQGVYI